MPTALPSDVPPDPTAAGEALAETQRLLLDFEPFGTTDLFGQVQRAAGIEPLGLLRFAAIPLDSLIAALDHDFAGIGTPEQTRIGLDGPREYVVEDTRFALRIATGIGPAQGSAAEVFPGICRRLAFLAARLLEDVREARKVFVVTAGPDETPQRLLRLRHALARHGGAMLLAVQPTADPAQAGGVEWVGPGTLRGWLARQTTVQDWADLCRRAADLRRAALSEQAAPSASSARPADFAPVPAPAVAAQPRGGLRVGICAIVRDEAEYIEEWVDFHRRQGVTAFRIYDNGSIDDTPRIIERLGIEPVIWAGHPPDFDAQQRAAYIEGAGMLAPHADWIAFIDIDEFVFGRGRSLPDALAALPLDAGAVAVQQRVFGSNGQQRKRPGGVLQRFTRSAPCDHAEHRWFKTIARPGAIEAFDSVHSVVLREGRYVMADGSSLVRAGPHPGEAGRRVEGSIGLHHYPLKSLEEFRAKQAKWSDRRAAVRMNDAYFYNRDRYANEEECRDLAEPRDQAAPPVVAPPRRAITPILFVQTADPFAYRAMLDLTSAVNIRYCETRGYGYESYLGIKRGVLPFHAIYNRIFILHELMERGYRGWVAYLDADAFVADWSFDIDAYLDANKDRCLIAATGGSSTPWDVNDGVLFLDLGSSDGRLLVWEWLAKFRSLIPEWYLTSPDAKWDQCPNDQDLLYEALKTGSLLEKIRKEEDGDLFNYRDGRFIRQATRGSFTNEEQRLAWIREQVRSILERNPAQPTGGRR